MEAPEEGNPAPEFELPDKDGKPVSLASLRGRWVVLYFYPKDDTPGCTTEACEFRDNLEVLRGAGAEIIGVSVDPPRSHQRFAAKYGLPFTLLSDKNKEVVQAYGVWGEKRFMGRTYLGTSRATFLIDPEGRIAKVYPKVRPEGHAGEVLADLRALQGR